MTAFVVLALALLVAMIGMAVVAGVVLRRQVQGLLRALDDAGSRIQAIASDLQSEVAVASLEVEGLARRRRPGQRHARG